LLLPAAYSYRHLLWSTLLALIWFAPGFEITVFQNRAALVFGPGFMAVFDQQSSWEFKTKKMKMMGCMQLNKGRYSGKS
jgi:hypothetical protein